VLPPTLPPSLATCLRRCLVKDPRQRIRDIGDVRLVLDGAFDTAAPLPAVSPPLVAPRRPLPWIAAFAVAAITAVALSIPVARHLRETPPPETRPEIVTPATVHPASFALAPDGRQIVFVASDEKASRLWLRPLSTTTAQPLAGTDGARNPFWSPDSKSVGFFAEGALKRLDLGGGVPQTLAPAPIGYGGTWSADGVIVYAPSFFNPLMRVSATGGGVTAVTTIGRQEWGHLHPQFLPDGRRFLFSIAGSDAPGIYLGRLDGSTTMRLTPDSTSGVYAHEGFLLWVRTGSLMAQRLDVEQPALTGEPVTIADGVAVDSNSYRSAVSVAETGLVAYRMAGALRHQLTWFDRSGAPRGIVGEPDDILNLPRVSPDGRRVAVVRTVQGNQDLWLLYDARASRFTFDPGAEFFPVWSPDGTRIMYTSLTVMGSLLNRLTSGAGGEERFLIDSDQIVAPSSWSENARFFMYNRIDPKTGADLWAVPMRGNVVDGKPFEVLKTPFREAYGAFSPDGRWVAYHSDESGRPEVYVRPFVPPGATDTPAAATGRVPVSTGGGIMAMWRSDGKELYYLNPDGAMMAVPIDVTGTAVEPGAPVLLFPTRIYGGGVDIQAGRQYDVTRDGRFLINTLLNEAAASITLLQNWNPEAKK
jgi:Tol biopolymer transport system component